ncbi:MAG: extracellular solute-binding protein [Rhodospirillales bacterium]|nr:extracellular solute-binding protein [Rhodospirillales bacterium]
MRIDGTFAAACALAVFAGATTAQAQVELRYMCYADANECEVSRDLLDRFEKANAGIKVVVDKVGFNVIREQLETRLEAGQGPDMARVTNLGGLNKYYLDLAPHVDAAYWNDNFGQTLNWMRVGPNDKGVYGFLTQLTITGPFVNKTMFAEAGVALPGPTATWDDWAAAIAQVQKKLNVYSGIEMDRTGHRFAGPAMSYGARYFDASGKPAVVDAGFKAFSERMVKWHKEGLMKEIWPGASGARWRNAADQFINKDTVMHVGGSWMIQRYSETIGDRFDWAAIPQPCGPAGCAAMPGGAAMVGFKATKNPQAVAKVMAFMASEPVLKEYYERTLQIPAHKGLAQKGLNYGSNVSPQAIAALKVFTANYEKIPPQAHQLQGYQRNVAIFNATANNISQAITGGLSLDEALKKVDEEIKQAVGN